MKTRVPRVTRDITHTIVEAGRVSIDETFVLDSGSFSKISCRDILCEIKVFVVEKCDIKHAT